MPQKLHYKRRSASSHTSSNKVKKLNDPSDVDHVTTEPTPEGHVLDNVEADDASVNEEDSENLNAESSEEKEIIEEEMEDDESEEQMLEFSNNHKEQDLLSRKREVGLPDELYLNDEDNNENNDGFDTRSEATSGSDHSDLDNGSSYVSDSEIDERDERGISPIVFDCSNSPNGEDITPPGESSVDVPKKTIVIPPAEVRAQRRERHNKMLKYLFRDARFFVIKSNNHENISLAKAKGVWSTPPSNEVKLNKAFKESRNVILIFSVRESGAFQGFARITMEARHDYGPIQWVLPAGLSAKALGGVIKIDWLCRRELSFLKTADIHNPFNDNKPVKIGRDGQEVEHSAGKILCLEFPHDDSIDLEGIIHKVRVKEKESGNIKYEMPRYPVPDNGPRMRSRRMGYRRHPGGPRYNPGNRIPRGFPSDLHTRSARYKDVRPRVRSQRYGDGRTNATEGSANRGSYSHVYSNSNYGDSRLPFDASDSFNSPYSNHPASNYYNIPPLMSQYPSSGQPSSAVISKYNNSPRISSCVSDVTARHYSSTNSRGYDSRAHAAACDDFVRRVASGRSAIVASTGRDASGSSSKSRLKREYESSRSRSDRENRYSRR